jgi:hypothetical protein
MFSYPTGMGAPVMPHRYMKISEKHFLRCNPRARLDSADRESTAATMTI